MSCSRDEGPAGTSEPDLRSQQQALTPAELRTINFEKLSDWQVWSGSGTLSSSHESSEGNFSLQVAGMGYAGVRNLTPLTKDDRQTPEVVSYDIWIPVASPNPNWRGDTQLTIDAPSAGIYQQYLGYRSLTNLPKGQWVRVEFPVPNWIRQALDASQYTDLRVVIAVNVPAGSSPHLLDRFRLGPIPEECTPTDDGNPCTADECDPSTGETSHVPLAPGAVCSDGNACNGVEACDGAGTCAAGDPPVLDDGNPCTSDSCDSQTGVSHLPVAAGTSCSDADSCNGSEVCDAAGSCQAGTAPELDDGNPCTADACHPTGGVTHTPVSVGVSCADGDACNGAEVCDGAGACQAGTPVQTEDGNACTIGSCEPATGQVTQTPAPLDSPCGDGNACNGFEFCNDSGVCLAGTAPEVDDGNPCTQDSCDPLFGVDHSPLPSLSSCGDGDLCNGLELCDGAGVCEAGTPLAVDDGNSCTSDRCDPLTGVSHDPVSDGAGCSDGSACTTTDTCQAGLCVGSDPIVCGALDACHDAGVCDPATGVCSDPVRPDGSACDDGVSCTAGDSCQAGVCRGGDAASLEESPCHVATCDPVTGGVVYDPLPEGAACQPDACSEGVCSALGECVLTASSVVDDGDPCTVDFCDPVLGPTHAECEPIDPTVATTVLSSTRWLFSGTSPVQTGVDPADIEERRASLLSGSVTSRDGAPIPSVRVTVNGHPEFGETVTQADGTFDMVVNGGGTLQVQFHKAGYLDSARRVDPRWNQTHEVEPVVLIPPDRVVSAVTLDAASTDYQVARGSVVTDTDGVRQGTLLFPPGVQATLRQADGSEQLIHDLHVRITEFTVGPEGPDAMPATLPTNTGYTYAFEVNADEAVAAGAPEITFSQPLVYYVDNFIGFPVGAVVPIGSYDRQRAQWVPHENGVVVKVLAVTEGRASLDLIGDGVAATPTQLAAAGITEDELTTLALDRAPGTTLWRVEIPHFTEPYDCNWPIKLPDDAEAPSDSPECECEDPSDPDQTCQASTLENQSQVLKERIPLAGSEFSLNYSSARVHGRLANRTIRVPIGSEIPASVKRVEVSLRVAGRTLKEVVEPIPGTQLEFYWDGFDHLGRQVQGSQPAFVEVRYAYDGLYNPSGRFGDPGLSTSDVSLTASRARREIYVTRIWPFQLGSWHAREVGLGGWTLSEHHAYVASGHELYLGTGERLEAKQLPAVVKRVGLDGDISSSAGIAAAADGSVYWCGAFSPQGHKLGRYLPDGRLEVLIDSLESVEGTYSGDGGPASEAGIGCLASSVALGPDGSIYFSGSDIPAVRRVDPAGIITTVAGQGGPRGYSGIGGPATEARIGNVLGLDVDGEGSLYIVTYDVTSHRTPTRLLKVAPDGIITQLEPTDVLDVAVDKRTGEVYFAQGTGPIRIFQLLPDGTYEHILGCTGGSDCVYGDYRRSDVRAISAYLYEGQPKIAVDPDGQVHLRAYQGSIQAGVDAFRTVWRVDPQGFLRTDFGGTKTFFDGVAGSEINMSASNLDISEGGLFFNRGGTLIVARPAYPGLGVSDFLIPDPRGDELFVFSPDGRHKSTLNARTGAARLSFGYDLQGRLNRVTNAFGQTTDIEHASAGAGISVTAPYGDMTELTLNDEGYLVGVNQPGQVTYGMDYAEGGLLSSFTDPTGGVTRFQYAEDGRIIADTDRLGATVHLTRTEDALSSWVVTRTSEQGAETTYDVERLQDGSEQRTNSYPDSTTKETRLTPSTEVTVAPDGTEVEVVAGADPQFGVMVPLTTTTTTLPSGTTRTVEERRTVSLSEPNNPASLTTATTTTVINGLSYQTTFTKAGLSYQSRSPVGRTTTQLVDEFDRLLQVQAPGAPRVRMQYAADKLTALIIDPDGILGNADDRRTSMAYDSAGQLVSVTDPLTHVTAFADYDEAHRPGTITLPDSSEVNMTYDVEGNVASVTPPGKSPHAMTYGIWGRIESYTPPVGNAVTYQYDLDRHVDLIDFGPDALGIPHQVDFTWDHPTGQLQSITSPTGTIDVGYTQGKMTSLISPSLSGPITTNIAYDGPLPTSLGWSGPVAGQVSWTYNDRFLIETETIGALPETTVTYQYDNDGLVTKAGDLTIARDPASGRVTSKTIGNIRERFQYNQYGELSRQTVERMSGTTVVETLYDVIYDDSGVNGARDALGRITKKTERIVQGDTPGSSARPLASRTYDYGYNQSGRPWLESVAVDGSVVSSYGYDANGNRTSAELDWSQLGYDASFDVSLGEADTEYNDADQLLTYGDTTYEWNNFGQLASKTNTATNETTFYEYDLYGNLLSVALPDGRTIEYDVDGAGRRVGRRVLDSQGTEIEYRGWIYRDLLRPIAEVDAAGNVVARYVYDDGNGSRQNGIGQLATRLGATQNPLLPLAGRTVPVMIQELENDGSVSRTLGLITNQVGTVQLVVDTSTGDVVQRLDGDPFGLPLPSTDSGLQPFGFAGGITDAATGLVRFGARDYLPGLGRWLTRDPILPAFGVRNGLVYSECDPVNKGDPGGLYFCNFTDSPIVVGGGTRDSNGGDDGSFGTGTVAAGECVGPDNPVNTPEGPVDDVDVADLNGDGTVEQPMGWWDTWPSGEKLPWGDARDKGIGVWDLSDCAAGGTPLPLGVGVD